jgi:RNA polymerase sigma-70 factor (ECF subfamily)
MLELRQMGEPDGELLEKAAEGDTAALRALLERFGPQVRNVIRGRIGKQWRAVLDADDVLQVTYLEAFLQIDQLNARDAASFAAWLTRIAENNLRDAIKELERQKRPHPSKRVQRGAGDESCLTLLEVVGGTTTTPSRKAAQREAADIIRSALDRLPADYCQAVRLYDLEGRSSEQVAATLGRSVGAVHMLRARAHDRLRALLGSESKFFSDKP